jgi:hypothetical protein
MITITRAATLVEKARSGRWYLHTRHTVRAVPIESGECSGVFDSLNSKRFIGELFAQSIEEWRAGNEPNIAWLGGSSSKYNSNVRAWSGLSQVASCCIDPDRIG